MPDAPVLHDVLSIQPTDDDGAVIANIDMTDMAGERYTAPYYLRPDDPYGLAPTIREWIETKATTVLPKLVVQPTTSAPSAISGMQFFKALVLRDKISMAEAVAAVRNRTPPSVIEDMFGALPTPQRLEMSLALWGANEYCRDHPIAALLGETFAWSDADLDAFWRSAAAL